MKNVINEQLRAALEHAWNYRPQEFLPKTKRVEASNYGRVCSVHRRFELTQESENQFVLTMQTIMEGEDFFRETFIELPFHIKGLAVLNELVSPYKMKKAFPFEPF